jgi:lipoprotein-releasing system permease protein
LYLPLFIAKRLAKPGNKGFSGFIMRLSIAATAISVAVMIISTALYDGFEQSISQKFYNCWGQVHISTYLPNESSFSQPDTLYLNKKLLGQLRQNVNVQSVEPYAIKSAIVKSKSGIEGLLLKGVYPTYDWKQFETYIQKGSTIKFTDTGYSNDILLSSTMATQLNAQVNDKLIAYFMQDDGNLPRARKLIVKGIYTTGLQENDKVFALCDQALINSLVQDTASRIFGYEIHLKNPKMQEAVADELYQQYLSNPLQAYTIKQRFNKVFQWLSLVKDNVNIIYIIMIAVAIINMITSMLIFIMDRTQMVGLLKSIGAKNSALRAIFFWQAMLISSVGILIGIVLAVLLCLIHNVYPLFTLNQEIYYVRTIPLIINVKKIALIASGTLGVSMLLLLIPTIIIRTIKPIKALRFD